MLRLAIAIATAIAVAMVNVKRMEDGNNVAGQGD